MISIPPELTSKTSDSKPRKLRIWLSNLSCLKPVVNLFVKRKRSKPNKSKSRLIRMSRMLH
jgi:hypothetical protein